MPEPLTPADAAVLRFVESLQDPRGPFPGSKDDGSGLGALNGLFSHARQIALQTAAGPMMAGTRDPHEALNALRAGIVYLRLAHRAGRNGRLSQTSHP